MPRDGSGNYTQPFPSVVNGTTIESAVYNGFTSDVAADLNAARPIVAGGTGATSAAVARFNMGAETAGQLVTNYSSHVWYPGSFRSAAAATGAPTVNAFLGTAIINEALTNPPTNANVMVEAHDMTTGTRYRRIKTAGVWSAWGDVVADFSGDFVLKSGDAMTGALTGTSMTMSGAVSAASVTASGTVSAANVTASGTVSAVSVTASGAVSAASVTASGTITAVAKGHQFGTSAGTVATGAVTRTDANILLYNGGATNWAGLGADGSGSMWFKTGTTGTPIPAMWINSANQVCTFTADSLSIAASNAAANPALTFTKAGTLQSLINDNGTSINVCSNSTGSVGMYIAHGASAWSALSDARLPYKKTAEPMAVLDRLHGVQLYEGRVEGRRELFVKAQELNKVFPQLVIQGSGPDDYVPSGMSDRAAWGVTYDRAGVVALQGLKELLARVEALEKKDG